MYTEFVYRAEPLDCSCSKFDPVIINRPFTMHCTIYNPINSLSSLGINTNGRNQVAPDVLYSM